jgi:hypothetical protein
MAVKKKLEYYVIYLNPHAKILLLEYQTAFKNKLWATSIILSLTIIDNILSDESNLDFIDGLELNRLKNLRDLHWLRMKRNQILHYEGPVEGFWGNYKSDNILREDALRSDLIINRFLKDFFSQKNL